MMRKNATTYSFFCLTIAFFLFACGSVKPPGIDKEAFRIKLEDIAREELSFSGVDYAVFIQGLVNKNFSFYLGERKQFPAASIIKIPILAAAIQAAGEGKIKLSDIVVIERKDITGGSGKLKAAKLPYTLTMEELLELMTAASDNTATNKIINILGFDYLRQTFKAFRLDDTVLARHIMDMSLRNRGVENYTSARDIATILSMIYHGELVNKELSQKALSFLVKQKVTDRIPRFLPEDVQVAHKTGLERGVIHDAGIVFAEGNDYLICVLVKNERTYEKGKKFIALVSLLTYNLSVHN
jgi:beta-lactamase class A